MHTGQKSKSPMRGGSGNIRRICGKYQINGKYLAKAKCAVSCLEAGAINNCRELHIPSRFNKLEQPR